MPDTHHPLIQGLDTLADVPQDRILIAGLDLEPDNPAVVLLQTIWPRARVLSFTDSATVHPGVRAVPKSLPGALQAARNVDASVVVVVQKARKLLLLALLMPVEATLLLRAGQLDRFTPASVAAEQPPWLKMRDVWRRGRELWSYADVPPPYVTPFYIVSAARHAGDAALRCLDSVHAQRYPNNLIEHLYIDDASTDGSDDIIRRWLRDHPDHRVNYVHNPTRLGGTKNTLDAFRRAPFGSVVIELNGDDWLPDAEVLSWLDRIYADPNVWATYNSCVFPDGRSRWLNQPYPEHVVEANAFRDVAWYGGHLRSFRAELFTHVSDAEMVDPETGAYWESADDQATFLAMLELAGSRARHVARTTCVYNHRALSEDVIDHSGSRARERRIRRLPRHTPLQYLGPAPSEGAPLVSVLMPVYNAGPYISEAISSVIEQSYTNFELIIINDGSTDDSLTIASRFAEQDRRIHIIQQANGGIVRALQTGLTHVRGDLIARMDADDRCLPHRLARQVGLLQSHADWVAVGSWVRRIDAQGNALQQDWRPPTSSGHIRWTLCFENCLPHGSVTMRRAALEQVGGYRSEALHAEDYDLWLRLSDVGLLANVPEALLELRIHHQRVGVRHNPVQQARSWRQSHDRIEQMLARAVPELVSRSLFDLHRRRPISASPLDVQQTLLDLRAAMSRDQRLAASDQHLIGFDTARKLVRLAKQVVASNPTAAAKAIGEARRCAPDRIAQMAGHRLVKRLIRPLKTTAEA